MAGVMVKRVLMQLTADDMDAEAKLDLLIAKAKELSDLHPELKPKVDSALALAQARVLREELKTALSPPRAEEVRQEWGSLIEQGIRPEILDVQSQIGKLRQRAADLKFKGDDKQLGLTIDRLKLKLQELQDKARPELDIRGIDRAMLEVRALGLEMDGLERKVTKRGLLSRILTGSTGGGGVAGLLGNIPMIGENIQSALGGDAAAAGSSPQLSGVLMGGLVASLPALLTETTALASGFAAAGAGAGAFYLLAHPAISNLQADVKSLDSANQALGIAQQKYLIDPTKANAKALQNAKDQYHAVYQQMGQDAGGAAGGVMKLHDEYVKLSTAFQPEAFKVFNGFLQVANNILPAVAPFAKTFADSLSGLLGQASKFTESKGFKQWLAQFESLSGPATTAIGTGIGHVTANFGKLFTIMSQKDVVNGINIAFSILDGTIIFLAGTIRFFMRQWDELTTAWDQTRRAAHRVAHDVASQWDDLRHKTAELGHDVAVWFDRIRHDIAQWAGDVRTDTGRVVSFFAGLPGRIGSALARLPGDLFSLGQHAVSMFVNGLKSIPVIGPVVGWAQDIWDHLPHSPARKGPLSGSGSPDVAGRRIGLMLASGMDESRVAVASAAARTARAAVTGTAAGGTVTAAGGGHVVIEIRGDAALRQWLKKSIRVTGGNVQVVGA